jgi:hypothetical protein
LYINCGRNLYICFSGPTFGGKHGSMNDLYIKTNMNSGVCNLGLSYHCRTGALGSDECRNDFCGSLNGWQITNLETYYFNNVDIITGKCRP